MVKWMFNVRPAEKISAKKPRTRLKLCVLKECILSRRLQWFGHPDRVEKTAWPRKCGTFKISGSFHMRAN